MPLFDPTREPDISPEDAVLVVHRFLQRTKAWAETREIPKRLQAVQAQRDPAETAKLHAWISYLRFTEHALGELEDGTLDHWFTPQP